MKFFSATEIAANSLAKEFRFDPYYNFEFHLCGILTFITHVLRALFNLLAFSLRLICSPVYILIPLLWFSAFEHFQELGDDFVGSILSVIQVVIHPAIFIIRTLTTLLRGYTEGNDLYDYGDDEDTEGLDAAFLITAPAVTA